jgi:CRISPR system Cascade subunit CasE
VTGELFLSRVRLNADAPTRALAALLDPGDRAQALDAHHRLLWALFADGPDRRRDFLWRADGGGRFYVLSRRPPRPHELFEPPETKAFEPALSPGDRLDFVLRANATRDRPTGERDPAAPKKDRRVDVVMDALRHVPPDERAAQRMRLATEAGRAWLERQGARHGFSIEAARAEDYGALPLRRPHGRRGARLGILDLAGTLRIEEPEAFLARLASGFGRAKAFGCGLMLIRRAA